MADRNINWDLKGNVFNIQKYSLHDGPGIRTILFLKGCSLRCKWCCNPESQESNSQVLFIKSRCIGCKKCENACPSNAIVFEESRRIDNLKCTHCGACAKICMAGALELNGTKMSVRDAVEEIKKDRTYYSYSGGGVTLSGGEALLQPDFAAEVLKACKQMGLNTAIETALFVNREAIDAVLPYTDLFLADFKLFDSTAHRSYTGQPNEKIKDNFKYIAQQGGNIIMRIPIIPTINDTKENLEKSAEFAKKIGSIKEVNLLSYHRLGVNKYEQVGRKYYMPKIKEPGKQKMYEYAKIFKNKGLDIAIGG